MIKTNSHDQPQCPWLMVGAIRGFSLSCHLNKKLPNWVPPWPSISSLCANLNWLPRCLAMTTMMILYFNNHFYLLVIKSLCVIFFFVCSPWFFCVYWYGLVLCFKLGLCSSWFPGKAFCFQALFPKMIHLITEEDIKRWWCWWPSHPGWSSDWCICAVSTLFS